jgi:ABC-type transport system involved in multi-copper enzyme maturation permease subunit
MIAPPHTGWLGRMRGLFEDRETRRTAAGMVAWLVVGGVLFALVQSYSVGTMILVATGWLLSPLVFARSATQQLFGPVFVYETVRVGRKRLTFILRTLYLFVLTFVLGMVFLEWLSSIGYWWPGFQGIRPNQLSQYGDLAFRFFAPVQFGVVCFLTPAYVAGSIADEKERKTLEFLFATDLRNREIVFGKLAARVVTLLMYIVAGLPVLSSLMLFGGIDPQMLIAAYAATIITMLGLAALSIYYSTMMRKPRDAIVVTYLTAGAYLIITTIAPFYLLAIQRIYGPVSLLGWEVPVETIGSWLGAGNPIFTIVQVFEFGVAVEDVGKKFALTYAIIIVVFLGISILRLRSIALRQSYGGVTAGKSKNKKKANTPSTRPICGNDPVFWKEVFVEGSGRQGWSLFLANLFLVILAFIWPAIIFANTHFDSEFRFLGFNTRNNEHFRQGCNIWLRVSTGILAFLMMMGAAVRGAGAVTGEKDRDTWISLIATPLSSWELLIGKWWGAVLSVRRFAWLLIAIWAFNLLVGAVYPFMLILTAAYLAVYIAAFGWVGVFCSCTARNTLIASIRVMMAGLFLSGGFWFVLACCCFMPLSIGRGNGDVAEFIGTSFLSLTPPFVSGWLPLDAFDRGAMGPFHPDERRSFGPYGVVFGFFLWIGFAATIAVMSMGAFQKLANRNTSDGLPEPLMQSSATVKNDPY